MVGQLLRARFGRITPRAQDFAQWYQDVVRMAPLAETQAGGAPGCMVLCPWGTALWERVQAAVQSRLTPLGVQNVYFPLLIPQASLQREAEHVHGFAKECAVVTHHRLRVIDRAGDGEGAQVEVDPEARLTEPLVVRPTSETLFWMKMREWIQSPQDLPLLLNQWANVFRWEMRTRPFLRSSEFLWQEGHTAHATRTDAMRFSQQILDLYADVCESELAMPVLKGEKSARERFAGADQTLTIEAMMPNGWALQCGTSHFLAQTFSRAFDVTVTGGGSSGGSGVGGGTGTRAGAGAGAGAGAKAGGEDATTTMHDQLRAVETEREHNVEPSLHPWGTSWGVSTRLIGGLVMTHSDDRGLVLPPRVAPVQVVIVPIPSGDAASSQGREVMDTAEHLHEALRCADIRSAVDRQTSHRLGRRLYEWERKGVPLRVELGARELAAGVCTVVSRATHEKHTVELPRRADEPMRVFAHTMQQGLDRLQQAMLRVARANMERRVVPVQTLEELLQYFDSPEARASHWNEDERSRPAFLEAPWCASAQNEAELRVRCKATIRLYKRTVDGSREDLQCIYSGEPATHIAVFARAY